MNDFSVKPLNEYPDKELETLFAACLVVKNGPHADKETKDQLDLWTYRLSEARKMKRKEGWNEIKSTTKNAYDEFEEENQYLFRTISIETIKP